MTTIPGQRKNLWKDPDFPANKCSLGFGDNPPEQFHSWMRPGEIVYHLNKREKKSYNPQFIVDNVSRFDVKQGYLNDCWLVAVLSCIANEDGVDANNHQNRWFKQVVLRQTEFVDEHYSGFFFFRFWHYGKWVPMIVDDRLPVDKEGKLIFAHSTQPNEFWAALLEKAYAKLYGSYNALSFGTPGEAFTDLTGGVYRMVKLEGTSSEKIKEVWKESIVNFRHKREVYTIHLVAAVISRSVDYKSLQGTGLSSEHVYSVTDLKTITKMDEVQIDLIRVRNPTGMKWKKEWSDESTEWEKVNEETKKERLTKKDGEFWMPLDYFTKYFTVIDICVVPEKFSHEDEIIQDFEWDTAADASNPPPQFRLSATNNSTLKFSYLQIMQKYREKLVIKNRFFHIGFKMFKVSECNKENHDCCDIVDIYKSCDVLPQRSVLKFLNDTEPGQYVIVPITDSLIEDGKFLIRLCQYKTTWKLEKIESYESCIKQLQYKDGANSVELQKLLCTFLPKDGINEAFADSIVRELVNLRNVQTIPNYKFSVYEFLCLMKFVRLYKETFLELSKENKYPDYILSQASDEQGKLKDLFKFLLKRDASSSV